MSLKNIVDRFQQGRREVRILYDDDAPLEIDEGKLSSYSRLELISYGAGCISRPRAVYEMAKFFISGEYLGGQGISQEELDDPDQLNVKKE